MTAATRAIPSLSVLYRPFLVLFALLSAACGGTAASHGDDAGTVGIALVGIEVAPADPSVPIGITRQLTATGVFSDSTTKDLTSQVTWASDRSSSVAVSATGVVAAAAIGTATITATHDSVVGSTTVHATDAVLVSVAVTPMHPSVPSGFTQVFTAMGTFSDATVHDLTHQVTWTSSRPAVAQVSNAPASPGLATALTIGDASITATLGEVSGVATITVSAAALVSIEVAPADPSVPLGRTQPLTATGTFSDTTTRDLTASATWASDAEAHVTVSNANGSRGVATARSVGPARITATLGGVTGATTVTATDAVLVSIEVTPTDPSVPLGATQQLTATGTFSDTTTRDLTASATWASDAEAHVTVSNANGSRGVATARGLGPARITATLDGVTGATTVTATDAVLVSIEVSPTDPSVPLGGTQQLTATGMFSDTTTRDLTASATWASDAEAHVTVSNAGGSRGVATARGVGPARITATLDGVTGATTVTATDAVLVSIEVSPAEPSVPLGRTQPLTATGTYSDTTTRDLTASATWASDAEAHVTVSNAGGSRGVATARGVGPARITATLDGVTGATTVTATDAVLVSIEITPTDPSVPLGATQQLTATGTFSDTTTRDLTASATWASDAEAHVTVSNAEGSRGVATARGVGPARITATLGEVSGATTVTTTDAVLVSIEIAPTDPSVPLGRTQQLTATGTYSDTTTRDLTASATWASDAEAHVTVSNAGGSRGVATARGVGPARITATLDGVTGATTVTATDAVLVSIEIAPTEPSVPLGRTQQFTATGTFSDTTTRDLTSTVTWETGAAAIAVVSNAPGTHGLATTTALGVAPIRAFIGSVTSATTLTVTDAALVSIAVSPFSPRVPLGLALHFTATGTFTDASTRNLTGEVTWTSDLDALATVSNADGSRGLATTLSVGATAIRATLSGVSGATTLTVTDAALTAITMGPPSPSVPAGLTRQLIAAGTYADGTVFDLTTRVTWASAAPAIATVSNADGSRGVATGRTQGSAAITATLGGVVGSTTLAVTAPQLVSLTASPDSVSLALGLTQQLTVFGTFSDQSVADVTSLVAWSTPSQSVVRVLSSGLVIAIAVGTTQITAAIGAVSRQIPVTVTPAVLASIRIDGAAHLSVPLGATLQLTATGTLTDTRQITLTDQVTWTSATPSVASVSNAAGTRGQVTGRAIGTAVISATLDGITASATVTVTAPVLASIAVTPANPTIALGRTLQLAATGTFTDGRTQDLTQQVTWDTNNQFILLVSNTPGARGLVTTVSSGITSVGVSIAGTFVTGGTQVMVTTPVLDTIAITPAHPVLLVDRTQQLTAIGTFSDATTRNLTNVVTWTSDAPDLISVSTSGTRGVLTTHAPGRATITAVLGLVTGTTTATATTAPLSAITVTSAAPLASLGGTQPYTATGTFGDTTLDITNEVTWSCSNQVIAQISNSDGSRGVVTPFTVGSATITATLGSVTGSAPLVTALAYIKAARGGSFREFGTSVALSADGSTLAVGAPGESSAATGIDGDQTSTAARSSGAVFVFTRNGLSWTQQAYIKASNTDVDDHFGGSVALSADGSMLAVGAVGESSAATGIGGDQTNNAALEAGAVYVFTRSGATWSQQAYLKASNTGVLDAFGSAVALSASGSILAVGAAGESSAATGIGGDQTSNAALEAGAVYVFARDGAAWSQQAYVKASNTGAIDQFGTAVALSTDGSVLAVGAPGEDSAATGIGGDQTSNAALDAGAVYVFTRSGATWSQQAYVKASNTGSNDAFGSALALAGDGSTLAVGAPGEASAARGIGGNQADNASVGAGAVYVFVQSGASWAQQAYVKASNTEPVKPDAGPDRFGHSVSLTADGSTLVVGADQESSPGLGIDGNQGNGADGAGAVYAFARAGAVWHQTHYVKASNTQIFAGFGSSVSLSADGTSYAVGSQFESGSGLGTRIDLPPPPHIPMGLDGAAYVYRR